MRRQQRSSEVTDSARGVRWKRSGKVTGPSRDRKKQKPTVDGSTSLAKLVVELQEQSQWCWAAVAQAIDHFYRPDSKLKQCQIASKQQGAGDCCHDPLTTACNRPLLLEKVLCSVNCLDQGPVPGTLSFSQLMNGIKAANPKPVCARIGWEDLGGHFVVIKGFLEKTQMLLIADPLDGERLVAFQEFLTNYQGFGKWSNYYLTDKVNHGNCI